MHVLLYLCVMTFLFSTNKDVPDNKQGCWKFSRFQNSFMTGRGNSVLWRVSSTKKTCCRLVPSLSPSLYVLLKGMKVVIYFDTVGGGYSSKRFYDLQ